MYGVVSTFNLNKPSLVRSILTVTRVQVVTQFVHVQRVARVGHWCLSNCYSGNVETVSNKARDERDEM